MTEQWVPHKIIVYHIWFKDQITTSLALASNRASIISHKELKKNFLKVILNVFIAALYFKMVFKVNMKNVSLKTDCSLSRDDKIVLYFPEGKKKKVI